MAQADFFSILLAVRPVCSMAQQSCIQRKQGVVGNDKCQAGHGVIERHEPHKNMEHAGKSLGGIAV
ncbi:MAG: hypothetical protein A2V62_07300 [Nitrospirae bacterium RBG_19FT_COMBO_58_9]|nr:MAG: hypothetical protein A2V62_07300 [Nitrospirae bacterium RBG_19FT_COMBO_58_9]